MTQPILLFLLVLVWPKTALNADNIDGNGDNYGHHQNISFESQGVTLAGTLVMPRADKPKAAVVFVHGSGRQSRSLSLAEALADRGVAALVYDKRGVGQSGGTYESKQSVSGPNIALLAADARAATDWLAAYLEAHNTLKDVPIGLTGISQAGWIVPLAAEKAKRVDFLILWSGPVTKVSEEDIFSKYTRDRDSKTPPAYADALKARRTPYVWPDFLGTDTAPSDSLRTLDIPGLWLFGAQDGSIPVDLSIERLDILKAEGRRFDYRVLPDAGHNNIAESIDMAVTWIGDHF